jgi:AraC-like DNA-binding protein
MSESVLPGDAVHPEPMRRHPLVHTTDVMLAERMGARFLSENHLQLQSVEDFDARIHGVSLGSISMFYLNYSTEVEVLAPPLDDYIAVVLPLSGKMDVDLAGQRFEVAAGCNAGVIGFERPLHMRWTAGYSMLCARIDKSALAAAVRALDPQGADRAVLFDPVVSRGAALDAIWGATRVIVDVFERLTATQRPTHLVADQLRDQLMTAVLLTQPNSHSAALVGPAPAVSHSAVGHAVDMIESAPERPHTVISMAKAVGVSVRALHDGFRRELGVTPAAYLMGVRLDKAHRELVAGADPHRTVADIAMAWGFSNPGRFAAYYRSRFGERPSDVLATHRPRPPTGSRSSRRRPVE